MHGSHGHQEYDHDLRHKSGRCRGVAAPRWRLTAMRWASRWPPLTAMLNYGIRRTPVPYGTPLACATSPWLMDTLGPSDAQARARGASRTGSLAWPTAWTQNMNSETIVRARSWASV